MPQTVAIFTQENGNLAPWDPESVRSGIAGSEEAVIYVSQSLARLGYRVTVFGNPPKNSPHSVADANPRFIRFDPAHVPRFDIGIVWRNPHNGVLVKQFATKVYLWPHDTWVFPLEKKLIDLYTDVLWLSRWQRNQWASVNPPFAKFTHVFGNGVPPEQFHSVQPRKNPYSCIYGSNYGRGLDILLNSWSTVKKRFPRATLDIYYGWQHWGLLSPEKEARMRKQIADLAPLGVTDHGLVGHEELTRAYERASFWTYPCTDTETFCITALRAQLAGAVPVVLSRAGLDETVQHGYRCSERSAYLQTLLQAMENAEQCSLEDRKKMGVFVSQDFSWDVIAAKWKKLF